MNHKVSLQIKWQATLTQSNVASLDAKQPRENAQKGSADYTMQGQKARWFETCRQLPTWQTFTCNLTLPPRGCQSDALKKRKI